MLPAFDPVAALDLIERHGVTATLVVPTMLAAINEEQLARPRDVASVRVIFHGGSPIATETLRRAHAAFPDTELAEMYGATETAPIATTFPNEERWLDSPRSRSCGQPAVGVEITILDSSGAPMPTGEVGEVAIRGENVMVGYWNKPEQTAAALVDGWYRSGDLGYLDDEGYVFLVDRAKDMIVTGGENVYSTEVEDILYRHPAVLEAAVFGVPDARWGEAVYAVVIPRSEVTSEELIAHCQEAIAGYKVPKQIELRTDPLPKSGAGKVLKRELREPYWAGRPNRGSPARDHRSSVGSRRASARAHRLDLRRAHRRAAALAARGRARLRGRGALPRSRADARRDRRRARAAAEAEGAASRSTKGVFVAHVLARPQIGFHLMHSMSQPRAEALARQAEFERTGHVDLGPILVEREGNVGRGHDPEPRVPELRGRRLDRDVRGGRRSRAARRRDRGRGACEARRRPIRSTRAAASSGRASTSRTCTTGRSRWSSS